MENVITEKRGLVIILVIATILIFVGLVWAIANYLPLNIFGSPSPSSTAEALVVGVNCTHPVAYWQKHFELYPAQLVIGGQVYKAMDIKGIFSDESTDPAVQLQAQLTGAYLNFLAGADQNSIEATIFEAYGWLVQHPIGSELTESDRDSGTRLINILVAYNMGLAGVAACETGLVLTVTGTSTATETPSPQVTLTPSETMTPTPSVTPTPTNFPTEPRYTVVVPSPTLFTTTSVPTYVTSTPMPATPTSTTAAPTNTTAPPTATNTPQPPTPTFTQPPTDTPTPTHPPID